MRTNPADMDFPDVADLVERWEGADLARRAELATQSAERTTTRRGPEGDPTKALARDLGALGWARAHTGSARALIFPPDEVPEDVESMLGDAGYQRLVRFRTGGET